MNNIDELFFADVEKIPAEQEYKNCSFNSYNNTIIKVKIENKQIIVNNCSEDYLLIPNKEIFPILENKMKAFGEMRIKRSVTDYSSFSVNYDFISDENKIKLAGTDIIFPRISVHNSYNSKHLFSINAAFYRCVCQNGLCLPVENMEFDSILSHCGGNVNKLVENSIEGISKFLNSAKNISKEYEPLLDFKVKVNEIDNYVEKILKGTKILLSRENDINMRINDESVKNNSEINMFNIYNGINYFLQPEHNSFITKDSISRKIMDEKVLDYVYDLI